MAGSMGQFDMKQACPGVNKLARKRTEFLHTYQCFASSSDFYFQCVWLIWLTCISLCFAGDCLKIVGSFIFQPKISSSENLTDEPAQNLLISFNTEWWIHSTHIVLDLFNPLRIKWRADIHPLCCIRNHSQKKHNKPTKWPKKIPFIYFPDAIKTL